MASVGHAEKNTLSRLEQRGDAISMDAVFALAEEVDVFESNSGSHWKGDCRKQEEGATCRLVRHVASVSLRAPVTDFAGSTGHTKRWPVPQLLCTGRSFHHIPARPGPEVLVLMG